MSSTARPAPVTWISPWATSAFKAHPTVFLWTSGPHEAILNVALKPGASISVHDLEEKLRRALPQEIPGSHFSFDPGDLVSQILNFGTPSVIEIATTGPQYNDVLSYAGKMQQELAKIGELRDLGYEEPLQSNTAKILEARVGIEPTHRRC